MRLINFRNFGELYGFEAKSFKFNPIIYKNRKLEEDIDFLYLEGQPELQIKYSNGEYVLVSGNPWDFLSEKDLSKMWVKYDDLKEYNL